MLIASSKEQQVIAQSPGEELPLCHVGSLLYHPGCEMRFRQTRCDGFRNPTNSWSTAAQKRHRSREWVLPYIVQTDFALPGKVRKTHHALREPGTIYLGEESGGRPCHS